MILHFATSDRQNALRFIQKTSSQGDKVTDTPGSAKELLDFVAKDIVRVQDPSMHGPRIAIIPGTYWDESLRDEVVAACKQVA